MGHQVLERVYLCPRCLQAQESPGKCPNDGEELLTCRPGSEDDPCRKPVIDRRGQIRTRAPLWWLRHSIGELAQRIEGKGF
jgi:hypothetical protein